MLVTNTTTTKNELRRPSESQEAMISLSPSRGLLPQSSSLGRPTVVLPPAAAVGVRSTAVTLLAGVATRGGRGSATTATAAATYRQVVAPVAAVADPLPPLAVTPGKSVTAVLLTRTSTPTNQSRRPSESEVTMASVTPSRGLFLQ